MAVEAVGGPSSSPAEATRNMQQQLDSAFDEFDMADLLKAHADLVCDLTERVQQLELGLESRSVIGKAIGICMERYGISDEHAFQFVVRLSQDHNVKLRIVAEQLVSSTFGETRTTPTTEPRAGGGAAT